MSMKDKIKNMLKGHEGRANKGIDKSGDIVDEKTHGRHRRQVDTGQDRLKDEFGTEGQDRRPPRP